MRNREVIWRVFIVLLVTLPGCVTQKRCNAKFPPAVEFHTEHTKETIVKDSLMPGATVYNTVFKDSIAYYPAYQWKVIRDTSGLTELRVMRDAYGNLMLQCETNDRLATRVEVLESKKDTEKKTVVKTEKETPWYNWIFITALALLCIYLRFLRK